MAHRGIRLGGDGVFGDAALNPLTYEWKATLAWTGTACLNARGRESSCGSKVVCASFSRLAAALTGA